MTGSGVMGNLTGSRMRRKEDPRILSGRGRFIDDAQSTTMLHACFVRSPVAHAELVGLDLTAARAVPGVVAVISGAELATWVQPINFGVPIEGVTTPTYDALSVDRVRHVGDPFAVVVAENRYIAEDAAHKVFAQFKPIPAVTSIATATVGNAPQLHHDVENNTIFVTKLSDGDVEGAFAAADHVVSMTFDQHRWAPVPIETRGGVAHFDPSMGMLTFESSCQAPHLVKFVVGSALGHPQHQIRVLSNDVGGSFGLKWCPSREDVVLCAVAKQLGATVKWIEDRNENLVAGGHAREETVFMEVAVRSDGTLLGMRADLTMVLGAYPMMPSAKVMTGIMRSMLPGPYRIPAYSTTESAVMTNKAPYLSLRGPWAVETLVRERMLDQVARAIGVSPIAIREKNLVQLDEQPYRSPAGFTYDNVTAAETFKRALEMIDYAEVESQLAKARAEGRIVGFGIGTMMEPAPGNSEMWSALGFSLFGEQTRVKLELDGHVSVYTVQTPNGQSYETTLAQIASDELGVEFEDIRVVYGDTETTPFSLIGTGGSRAGTLATGAVITASRTVKKKVLDIAAKMLEVSAEDLQISSGVISVVGASDISINLADIAMGCYMAPDAMPAGLDLELQASEYYDGEGGGFAQATHCCWVEINRDTGLIDVTRFLAVEDCGKMINPAVVEGQIRGAIAMGLGGMLFEEIVYDDAGNCLTGTFLDYLLPTAQETPDFEIEHLEFESEKMVGSRGCGEGGTILAPAALTNAVEDALVAAGGGIVTATPLTPTRVLELLGTIAADS